MFNSELTKYLLLPLLPGTRWRPVLGWFTVSHPWWTGRCHLSGSLRTESFWLYVMNHFSFLVARLPYGGRYGKEWLYRRLTGTGEERWHYLPFIPDSESITWTIDFNFHLQPYYFQDCLLVIAVFPCVLLMRIISGRKGQETRKMAKVRSHTTCSKVQ